MDARPLPWQADTAGTGRAAWAVQIKEAERQLDPLLEPIGYVPPAEAEAAFYAELDDPALAA